MALTKNLIVERIQDKLGRPENQSNEITETLLEIIKADWRPETMSCFLVSASSM